MAELNLIPYSIREKRRKIFIYRQYISLVIIVLCILFFGVYFPMGTLSGLKNKAASLKQQIGTYQYVIKQNQTINNQMDTLNKYINEVKELTVNKVIVTDKIRGIEAFIPKDIVFSSLDYNVNLISINGTASNYSSISEFAANLQMSKGYSNAKINDINYDEVNKAYNFTLNIKY